MVKHKFTKQNTDRIMISGDKKIVERIYNVLNKHQLWYKYATIGSFINIACEKELDRLEEEMNLEVLKDDE